MALDHVGGLDHVVILVRDLDRAASAWASLGFTLSPRGTHSPHKGTANHTIMLAEDYVELLGVLADTPLNAGDRAALAEHGEGLDRAALRTDDAAGAVAALRAAGIEAVGPQSFSRPVSTPTGDALKAAFNTFEWPVEAAPAGLRLFACQHLTPEAVWMPPLMSHPNTAVAIARLEMLSTDPEGEAHELASLAGGTAMPCPDGAWRVPSGAGRRGDLVLLDPALLLARYPDMPVVSCRASGAAALVLQVESVEVATRVSFARRIGTGKAAVAPETANGVLLVFEEG